jgi:hypothetical protein
MIPCNDTPRLASYPQHEALITALRSALRSATDSQNHDAIADALKAAEAGMPSRTLSVHDRANELTCLRLAARHLKSANGAGRTDEERCALEDARRAMTSALFERLQDDAKGN